MNPVAFLKLCGVRRNKRARITRQGDTEMRTLLVQAAHGLLRSRADSDLKQWAQGLAGRVGKKKAVVALARKLAGKGKERKEKEKEKEKKRCLARRSAIVVEQEVIMGARYVVSRFVVGRGSRSPLASRPSRPRRS